ncbi:MAG: IMP cyclohydrolase [Candidatus Hydrogenedentes bacterium]|nr:IMP cyclohydrolase [Candidatus Hydrogenedentota bacterium]
MPKIARALLSCYDKTGLVELAETLREFEVEIISTSGTLKVLHEAGIEAISISDFTGVPEMMDGRVKSLHPKVHAGLLGIRDNKLHQEQMQAYEMQWIDMLVVNLPPLTEWLAQEDRTPDELFERTDIGGAAMIRSGAKNFRYVTVVVNPERYPKIRHELYAHEGKVSYPTRSRLAQEAFYCTAEYDRTIADYLKRIEPPIE